MSPSKVGAREEANTRLGRIRSINIATWYVDSICAHTHTPPTNVASATVTA
jgi:hypothetical protein